MLCEAAICYTGDILDPTRSKYNLRYYVDLAMVGLFGGIATGIAMPNLNTLVEALRFSGTRPTWCQFEET
jgi:pyruvate carboxylase